MSVLFYEPSDLQRFADVLFPSEAKMQGVQARASEGEAKSYKPKMDLHEDIEKNLITATFEFPGAAKEDVQIDLNNGKLIVSAGTKQSEELKENGYVVRERRCGKHSRTIQLPQGIKDEEIKASIENGLLTITFPKLTPELAPKRITIA